MLACSFDATQKRIINRGRHTAPFSSQSDGGQIADAVRTALYADEQDNEHFLGLSQPELANLVYSNGLLWAPDGDEAFDDGSFVLQFDVGESVRLIAFKALRSSDKPYLHDPATLSDVWLPAETFYGVLQQWGETFEAAWKGLPKEPFGENTVH
jgi:hypothetical protein